MGTRRNHGDRRQVPSEQRYHYPASGRHVSGDRAVTVILPLLLRYAVLGRRSVMKLWWDIPGMNTSALEDPVLWYSDGMYHIVVNNWQEKYAYYLTSYDGVQDWTLHTGTAYSAETMAQHLAVHRWNEKLLDQTGTSGRLH